MGQNAITDADKERRRSVLLDAARVLFRQRNDLPPVAEIARAAGLAKGTVYLYFNSKEEIFIALLEAAFTRLFDQLEQIIPHLPAEPQAAAPQFADAYTQAILGLDELLPLASLANGLLEQNLPVSVLRPFKTRMAAGLSRAGQQLECRFAALGDGGGATLLLHTHALTLGLWQSLNYPPVLRALLTEPSLQSLNRPFPAELGRGVCALWRGALS